MFPSRRIIVWLLAVAMVASLAVRAPTATGDEFARPVSATTPLGAHLPAHRPRVFLPEQRHIDVRQPEQFHPSEVPITPAPQTVADEIGPADLPLSLDEAIRTALANSEVVRILSGVTASNSGQTIYSAAIANTAIDEQQARFDPNLTSQHNFNRMGTPNAVRIPVPPEARIVGTRTNDYDTRTGITKTTQTGGTAALNVNANHARFEPPGTSVLNPRTRHSVDLSYTQPLYRGGGISANRAPIVIARLDAERSFFQYKGSLQQMVRGVIAAYWALVFARTDQWAREQQVQQAQFAFEQAEGRFKAKTASRAVVAQTRVSLGNFKTTLTAAKNNVLLREAALRNVMGLPPADGRRIIPVTPPADQRAEFDWASLLSLGEMYRPDVIEAKLVLEADEQQRLIALNNANPNIDANALYRWNGLSGTTPTGAHIAASGGQFTDWTLGVTFSVPLSLRQERAALRRRDLIIAQDRAFLKQTKHNMAHNMAVSVRNLEQFFEQYEEFHSIREDAELNLQERGARFRTGGVGGVTYVEVLLAITDWGNTVSAEAQALTNYNTELANLELETGTILQSHGIHFYETHRHSAGPLGWLGKDKTYPASMEPAPNADRYQRGGEAAENFFELDDPLPQSNRRPAAQPEELPAPSGMSLRSRLRR